METMAEESGGADAVPAVAAMLAVSGRAQIFLADITEEEIDFATSTTMGERLVEIPGRQTAAQAAAKP